MRFSFVTLNLWRLREPHRVAPLLLALKRLGRELDDGDGAPFPDLIALQELESQSLLEQLGAALLTHQLLVSCVCARKSSGEHRSTMAIAVRRDRFVVEHKECIRLDRLWPDHGRCALFLRLRPPDEAVPLDVVNVHLSARPWNGGQARQLASELRKRGVLGSPRVLIAGDFNCTRRAAGYRCFADPSLRDAFPGDRTPTHWFGRRIDHVLIGARLSLRRSLSRAISVEAVRQARPFAPWWRARSSDRPDVPLTDHLPLGAIFED